MQAPHHHAHGHSHSHQHSHTHHHSSSTSSSGSNAGHSHSGQSHKQRGGSPRATSVGANQSDTSSLISTTNNLESDEKLIEVDVTSNDDSRAGACSALFILSQPYVAGREINKKMIHCFKIIHEQSDHFVDKKNLLLLKAIFSRNIFWFILEFDRFLFANCLGFRSILVLFLPVDLRSRIDFNFPHWSPGHFAAWEK